MNNIQDSEYKKSIVELHRKAIKHQDPISHAISENLLERLDLNSNQEIRKLNLDQPEMFGAYVKRPGRPQSAGVEEADRFNQIKFLMHLKENG